MSRYASGTAVAIDRSEAEIKKVLQRYGGDDIVTGSSSRQGKAFVQFWFRGMHIQIDIALPDQQDRKFTVSDAGRTRKPDAALKEYEAACRQQWRVLLLLIRAQLEAVENGIVPPQQAWMPWIMLPSGRTVSQEIGSGLDKWIATGQAPKMLPFAVDGGQ